MRRTLTVILASDVAEYSRLVASHEEETIARFRQAAAMFSDLVKKYQGAVFNTAGDAILAQFDSAVDATRCALDIQDANNASNAHIPERERVLFRIGIAIGDVLVAENGDLLGDAVNVAARLESLAEPGGICISDEFRSHVLTRYASTSLISATRTFAIFRAPSAPSSSSRTSRTQPNGNRNPDAGSHCGIPSPGWPRQSQPYAF